jgi:NADH-quinone oxidoreductase subunit D
MLYGFREREEILRIFEMVDRASDEPRVRPGGRLVMDLPEGAEDRIRGAVRMLRGRIEEYERLLTGNPIWRQRNVGVGRCARRTSWPWASPGPALRASGVAATCATAPYCGYETYDFDVPRRPSDCFARYEVRMEEMRQSLRIVEQCLERLEPGPVMVEDPKVRVARRSSRSGPTASATPRRTCNTSWRSRWRR